MVWFGDGEGGWLGLIQAKVVGSDSATVIGSVRVWRRWLVRSDSGEGGWFGSDSAKVIGCVR